MYVEVIVIINAKQDIKGNTKLRYRYPPWNLSTKHWNVKMPANMQVRETAMQRNGLTNNDAKISFPF